MNTGGANALLARAGRNGPALLCIGVLAGLAAPWLAEAARPLMGVAVFVFTLGAFLKVDAAAFRAEAAPPRRTLLILAWVGFGVPLFACALLRLMRPAPDLALGVLLCTLAPPVGSAAAIAAMVGLNAPLALLSTLAATVAAPVYLPLAAALLADAELAIEPVSMALRLAAIIGGAAAAAWLLRRRAGRWVAGNPSAMTGIAVLGLLLVAVGAMRGMRAQILQAPWQAALWLALAFLVNAGLQAIGTLLFAGFGLRRALTVGLVSGNRNITLVWAAAAPVLADHPAVELFLAMSVFPIFLLPAAMQRLVAAVPERDRAAQIAEPPRGGAERS